jgi:hypothetical protein
LVQALTGKMSLHNKQTKLNETKPDRLASAMLIIGIFIVCQFALYGIIFSYSGGLLLPSYLLPFVFLGGIGIVYGLFRTVRGGSVTRQYVKATLINMTNGAIAGSATAIAVITIIQVIGIGYFPHWTFFFLAIPGGLFFGITPGGISGLILGKIWKNKKTIFVGSAISGAITSFCIIYIYNLFNITSF